MAQALSVRLAPDELAQTGLRVVLVDANAIGSGGTNLSYGSLCVLDQTPAQFALTRYGLALCGTNWWNFCRPIANTAAVGRRGWLSIRLRRRN